MTVKLRKVILDVVTDDGTTLGQCVPVESLEDLPRALSDLTEALMRQLEERGRREAR